MLILFAALGGAIVSGLLLMTSDYLRSKREEAREQRNFERTTHVATLIPIKTVIDTGTILISSLALEALTNNEISQVELEERKRLLIAANRARVTARTLEEPELDANLVQLALAFFEATDGTPKDMDAIATMVDQTQSILSDIEKQYINLTRAFSPAPNSPWWW